MSEEYEALLADMKALTQTVDGTTVTGTTVTLPVAEHGWNTRPDAESYGEIQLDFEADALGGDDRKVARAFEGSVDLYSRNRSGGGWVPLIEQLLTEHCGAHWTLNHHAHERETALFHWEWAFQVEG